MGDDCSPATANASLIAELRAITTALRLGGLHTLARSTITRSPEGVVLSLACAPARDRTDVG